MQHINKYIFLSIILFIICCNNNNVQIDDDYLVFNVTIPNREAPQFGVNSIRNITNSAATLEGEIIDFNDFNSFEYHGHLWNPVDSNFLLSTAKFRTNLGRLTSPSGFISQAENLEANTTYYVRSWVGIDDEAAMDSKVYKFQTTSSDNGESPALEKVLIIEEVNSFFARTKLYLLNTGSTTDANIGFCYSTTNDNPTVEDNVSNIGSVNYIGEYTENINNLSHSTTYYLRGFAQNSNGIEYSDAISFTTKQGLIDGFVFVEGGSFQMGNNNGDQDESPEHTVSVGSFLIQETEVTNEEFAIFLNEYGSIKVKEGEGEGFAIIDTMGNKELIFSNGMWLAKKEYEKRPVHSVSWYGANEYCKLFEYRLPTEAEWEYVARNKGLDENIYSGGNMPTDVAWYNLNAESTMDVKTKEPNLLGIYDLSGNVWEWCSDWYFVDYYQISPSNQPTGPNLLDGEKVIRGGAWNNQEEALRTTNRGRAKPFDIFLSTGFRCVKDL